VEGVRKAFAVPDRELNIGSIKANIGHCECAAGVAGVIKALLMVNKGIIPPVANFHRLNPKIPAIAPDNITISTAAKPWTALTRLLFSTAMGQQAAMRH
jgi:acyl transferase domain-containing protein